MDLLRHRAALALPLFVNGGTCWVIGSGDSWVECECSELPDDTVRGKFDRRSKFHQLPNIGMFQAVWVAYAKKVGNESAKNGLGKGCLCNQDSLVTWFARAIQWIVNIDIIRQQRILTCELRWQAGLFLIFHDVEFQYKRVSPPQKEMNKAKHVNKSCYGCSCDGRRGIGGRRAKGEKQEERGWVRRQERRMRALLLSQNKHTHTHTQMYHTVFKSTKRGTTSQAHVCVCVCVCVCVYVCVCVCVWMYAKPGLLSKRQFYVL